MSELWKIILTASITIAGGIIVYVLGHFLVILFVEPIHRLRSFIGEIADSLVFYANVYSNPGYGQKKIMDEASEVLRRQASQLRARVYSIPWYSLWAFTGFVRGKKKIEEASAELIGLSNSVHRSEPNLGIQNYKRREKIEELLGIQSGKKQKSSQPINRHILSDGILLFLFSLILFGVKPSTLVIFGFEIFTFPIWSYMALGIIALALSISFMVAVFWKQLAARMEGVLEERVRSRWQAFIQYLYFIVFLLVYTVSWLKGLSFIPAEEFIFDVVLWFGFIWLLVILVAFLIIPITHRIKVRRQRRK